MPIRIERAEDLANRFLERAKSNEHGGVRFDPVGFVTFKEIATAFSELAQLKRLNEREYFEYALQFRFKKEGELWDICNYTKGLPLNLLKTMVETQRKDYPQYEWRIVMKESTEWYLYTED